MRARTVAVVLAPLGPVVMLAACLGGTTTVSSAGNDAGAALDDSGSGVFQGDASGAVETSAPQDSAAPDATVPTGDAAVPDASDVAVADAAVPDASDAAVVDATALDASDAAILDASDAAVVDASDAGSGVALQFDGVDDQVEMTTEDGGANETAYSIEAWFNSTNPTGTMFEVYGGGGADRFLFLQNGNVCFYVYGTPVTTVCSPTAAYADGAWHYAAGTLGAIGGTQVYVDGVLSASSATPTSSAFNYDTSFRLGYGHTALNSALVYFGGKLDEVRVWSIERSASDILATYNTHIPGTTAGLQGYWKLDESGAATTATDSTPFGHDGTLVGFTFPPSPWVTPGAF